MRRSDGFGFSGSRCITGKANERRTTLTALMRQHMMMKRCKSQHGAGRLPFFVLFKQTKSSVIANTSQKGEEDEEDEPDAQIDDQVLRYALVLFDDEAGSV